MKKLLTIDDLVLFCKNRNFTKFSSAESGYQLAVQIPTTFEVDNNVDENHRGMTRLKFRIFHIGLNRNGSYVSEKAAKKAMNTIADRPVLAAIHQLDNGEWDFSGHDMELLTDENGHNSVNYIEKQVGSFSSEKPFWEHDDELDKDYVCAYAYVSDEYTKASEIIKRKNGTKNSCELCIDELSYNIKENYLELTEFYVNASTLLGSRSDGTEIGEGMIGSRADIADFSVDNNSVSYEQNNKLIDTLERLNITLSNFNIQTVSVEDSKKGGNTMTTLENLLAKYEKSIDDITFDYEGLSDEELEAAFAEAFTDAEPEGEPDGEPEGEPENFDDEDKPTENKSLEFSVNINGEVKTFSVSLSQKIEAMFNLVNETYSEQDNDIYDVDVFEDEGRVHMMGWFTGKSYRQEFKCKKNKYTLVGDRVETFSKFLTQDEINQLESMKSNYSSIESELNTTKESYEKCENELNEVKETLAKYEAEPEKMSILNSEDYSQIAESDDFVALKEQDAHFDMSIEDVKAKADAILLNAAKSGKIEFSNKPKSNVGRTSLISDVKVTKRFGSLFDGII